MAAETGQERSEQPTQRKVERSQSRGQIAYSSDLTAGLSLLAVTIALAMGRELLIPEMGDEVRRMADELSHVGRDEVEIPSMISRAAASTIRLSAPVMGVAFGGALLFGATLAGFRIAPQAFRWEPGRLDPVAGFRRLFSQRGWMRGGMSVLKLAVISMLATAVLRPQLAVHPLTGDLSLHEHVTSVINLSLWLLAAVSGGLIALGIIDYGFQFWHYYNDLKMTRRELQDEHREDDGDPHVRARVKRLQREISQRNLRQQVESATVVLTNPTHYAVCLKYTPEMSAPLVVAKGKDFLARQIVQIARAGKIPVVERKPLARGLYHGVPAGKEIPAELYQAVAEVLAYIYALEREAA
jgi:flagellar biosynthesis protein FlhB